MIPRTTPLWQAELAAAVSSPIELLLRVGLAPDVLPLSLHNSFSVRVPEGYIARMRRNDPDDPLLRQVLALSQEDQPADGYGTDPVREATATAVPGLLRKYRGRALLITTGACPIHCRYCFRRHFPYAVGSASGRAAQAALDHIRADPTIDELILSGGDPLMLPDGRLSGLLTRLSRVSHLRRVRIHTRMPIVLPSRVDASLLRSVADCPLQVVFVLHTNHANEIDTAVAGAARELTQAGVTLLNQSVLLRGVNDDAETLCALSEALMDIRVLPYYLHQLDRVQGAAHFAVRDNRALRLMHSLRSRLPGYLVPRLVREQAGAPYKKPAG